MRSSDPIVQKKSTEIPIATLGEHTISDRSIIVIGQFPPPVHGFAQATMSMAKFLESQGFSVLKVDLKPLLVENGFWTLLKTRIEQLVQVFHGILHGSPVYVALSGGLRQAIDLLFIFLARLANVRIYVHHHSFAYIDKPHILARICFWLSGLDATHFVLCEKMGKTLRQRYKSVRNTEVISNAGLPSITSSFRFRPYPQKIGYLGALTREKGIVEFLNFVKVAGVRYPHLSFAIAGPCSDDSILAQVVALCRKNCQVTYMGPVYGEAKSAFLQSLDVLLFPTRYRNEAEPLVIWEAVSAGIPVISWERGCIKEMLSCPDVLSPHIVPRQTEFLEAALTTIEHWIRSPRDYQKAALTLRNRFESISASSMANLARIFPSNRSST